VGQDVEEEGGGNEKEESEEKKENRRKSTKGEDIGREGVGGEIKEE
jgi:hypothetical protein